MNNKWVTGFVMSTALLASPMISTTPVSAAGLSFTDIKQSYAKDAILKLAESGIVIGVSNEKFNPTGTISRQDFAIILAKALKLDVTDTPIKPTFTDIPQTHYAYTYVEAAAKAGLIKGYGNGKFGLNDALSRQDLAILFVRALNVDPTGYGAKIQFTDMDSTSDYAKDAIAFAVDAGLLKGTGNNRFNPKGNAKREDVAVVASKFVDVKDEYLTPEPTPTPEPEPTPEVPVPIPDPVPIPELPVPIPDPVPTSDPEQQDDPVVLNPPISTTQTRTLGSLPHFRHGWDVNYGAAITQIILQKDGEEPITYTVGTDNIFSNASDIVVISHGTYTTVGTYVWTIKATGYVDATVEVIIPPLELTLTVDNPQGNPGTISLPASFADSSITWLIVEGSGSIYTPNVYTTVNRESYVQTAILEASFSNGTKKYFTVTIPSDGSITVESNPNYTPPNRSDDGFEIPGG